MAKERIIFSKEHTAPFAEAFAAIETLGNELRKNAPAGSKPIPSMQKYRQHTDASQLYVYDEATNSSTPFDSKSPAHRDVDYVYSKQAADTLQQYNANFAKLLSLAQQQDMRKLQGFTDGGMVVPYFPRDLEWKRTARPFLENPHIRISDDDRGIITDMDKILSEKLSDKVDTTPGQESTTMVPTEVSADIGKNHHYTLFPTLQLAVGNEVKRLTLEKLEGKDFNSEKENALKVAKNFLVTIEAMREQSDHYHNPKGWERGQKDPSRNQELFAYNPTPQASKGETEFTNLHFATIPEASVLYSFKGVSSCRREDRNQLIQAGADDEVLQAVRENRRKKRNPATAIEEKIFSHTGTPVEVEMHDGTKQMLHMPDDFMPDNAERAKAFTLVARDSAQLITQQKMLDSTVAAKKAAMEKSIQEGKINISDLSPAKLQEDMNTIASTLRTQAKQGKVDWEAGIALCNAIDALEDNPPQGKEQQLIAGAIKGFMNSMLKEMPPEIRAKTGEKLKERINNGYWALNVTISSPEIYDKQRAQLDRWEKNYHDRTGIDFEIESPELQAHAKKAVIARASYAKTHPRINPAGTATLER